MIIHAYASTLKVWSLESCKGTWKVSILLWCGWPSHYILGATPQWVVDLNKLNRPVLLSSTPYLFGRRAASDFVSQEKDLSKLPFLDLQSIKASPKFLVLDWYQQSYCAKGIENP